MKKLLLHIDTDPTPSTFDQVVAYDEGVDNIIEHSNANADSVINHVHGMIFTRSVKNLKNSAIFIGGSDVVASELVGEAVKQAFFGPVRISVMLDPNGSNTTAAAVARKVIHNYDIKAKNIVIIGAGPVGQRAALYFLKEGAGKVTITSRSLSRAKAIAHQMKETYGVNVTPGEARNDESVAQLVRDAHVAIASGPAGVCVLPRSVWTSSPTLEVVADINAVPPLGIEGVDIMDNGAEREGVRFFGAIAIGNFKMKVHRAAVSALFDRNDQFFDESTIYNIACDISAE